MIRPTVVTGTDTGIGKTVFSSGLAGFLGAKYWKPIQSGLDEETDSEIVTRLGGLSPDRILPERYRLQPLLRPTVPPKSTALPSIRNRFACLTSARARLSSRARVA
jgi:dethiobiotin synthetase